MGDVSLPQPRDFYRITLDNGMYANNLDRERVERLVSGSDEYITLTGRVVKVEHCIVQVTVTDVTSMYVEDTSTDDCECGEPKQQHGEQWNGCRWCSCELVWTS